MATLVDTSVWIDHFQRSNPQLVALLESGDLLIHSAVIGELASGSLKNRASVLGNLKQIPRSIESTPDESLELLERHKLHGQGLSWIDIQILSSCMISNCQLLTKDKRLKRKFEEIR